MDYFLEALKKYATFTGRARRKEYWYFNLVVIVVGIVLAIVDGIAGTFNEEAEIGLFSGLFLFAVLLPSIAVLVRRLHDTDRSGWWALLNAVPVVGAMVVFVFTVLDSQPGTNRFGPNPKGWPGPDSGARTPTAASTGMPG